LFIIRSYNLDRLLLRLSLQKKALEIVVV